MVKTVIYPSSDELILAAAEYFISLADGEIKKNGLFTVSLSGGSTPQPLYEFLAQDRVSAKLDWNKIHFFWADERHVLPDHPDSNFNQAYQTLLKPRQVPKENIHRIQGELEPKIAAKKYQESIQDWFGNTLPQFDLILLGMGSDGHTASLFPGTESVIQPKNYDLVTANYLPLQDTWRITLMPKIINASKRIIFLVSGLAKADSLYRVLEGPYLPAQYPAQMIRPTNGELIWMIDQDAGSLLIE